MQSNIGTLIKEGLGPRTENDLLLARDTCVAFSKLSTKVRLSFARLSDRKQIFRQLKWCYHTWLNLFLIYWTNMKPVVVKDSNSNDLAWGPWHCLSLSLTFKFSVWSRQWTCIFNSECIRWSQREYIHICQVLCCSVLQCKTICVMVQSVFSFLHRPRAILWTNHFDWSKTTNSGNGWSICWSRVTFNICWHFSCMFGLLVSQNDDQIRHCDQCDYRLAV